MSKILTITDVGLAEIINQESLGIGPVVIDRLVVSSAKLAGDLRELTTVPDVIKSIDGLTGGVAGDNILNVVAQDASEDAYTVFTVGLYSTTNVLIGVYSQNDAIVTKTAASIAVMVFDYALVNIDPASITVGNIEFVNPPATTTRAGVAELATDAETQAGADTTRVVTPAGLNSRTATAGRTGLVELATAAETQAGTDGTRAVTPAGLNSRTATESRTGIVELATAAETQAGSDTARAITPAGLSSRTATETRTGLVELATIAEATAGTDTQRAVTPAGVKAAALANAPGAATDTAAGVVELATSAETIAGSDATRAVTPAGLHSRTATESRTGLVELATVAETTTGTDTSRAVTPAGVKAVVGNLGTASQVDVVTTLNDSTPGRALMTGSGGWMGAAPWQSVYNFDALGQVTQARTLTSLSPGTLPSADIPGFPDNAFVTIGRRSSGEQMVQCAITFEGVDARMAFRHRSAVGLSRWVEPWTNANLVKTTSATDTTAGRMLKVGDGGLLGISPGGNFDLATALGTVNRFFWAGSGDSSGLENVPEIAGSKQSGHGIQVVRNAAAKTIIYFNNAQSAGKRMWIGGGTSTTVGPWYEVYTTFNTSSIVQSLLAATDAEGLADAIGTATDSTRGVVELATNTETQGGTDATRAVTPASLSSRTATTNRTGLVELATAEMVSVGVDDTRAVTPAGLSGRTATDSRTGLVELATNTETQSGSDSTRAVTPASLSSRSATENRTGLVELATNAEAATGTDAVRAVTPAGAKALLDARFPVLLGATTSTATYTNPNIGLISTKHFDVRKISYPGFSILCGSFEFISIAASVINFTKLFTLGAGFRPSTPTPLSATIWRDASGGSFEPIVLSIAQDGSAYDFGTGYFELSNGDRILGSFAINIFD